MILNELSLHSKCNTLEEAQKAMQDFLERYSEMERLLFKEGIILTENFNNFILTEGYSIHNWNGDNRIEKRLKDKFRSLKNRSQYINKDDFWNSEFKVMAFNQENAIGCLIAYERQDLVISLRTHKLWDDNAINGLYFTVNSDLNDKPINVTVPNISQHLHVANFKEKIIEETFTLISSGQDLWEKKNLIYPHLIFCDGVQDQLMLDAEKVHIEQIMKRLRKMEEYFATFNGVFDCKKLGLGSRRESESVMKNAGYKQQRVFKTPYGEEKVFDWHIDFSGKFPGRIHFLPDEERKKCLIGYIGKHLPTTKYPTI